MRMSITVTGVGKMLVGLENPGVIMQQWNKLLYGALEVAANVFWLEILPDKFRRGVESRYPGAFFPRKGVTLTKKQKRYGHMAPLVNYPLGQPPPDRMTMERLLLAKHGAIPFIRVNKTRKEVTANWTAPPVSEVYKDEVIAIRPDDKARIGRAMHDWITSGLRRGVRWRKRVPAKMRFSQSQSRSMRIRHSQPRSKRITRKVPF